ncbi:MAG: hypothetical protein IJW15_02585 [Clostridia bacterium]|nr:hypothetical protein [Clostridia bacterium]
MKTTFDSEEYIKTLGEELVNDFLKAGKTTHPCSVGSGRERALINKLKSILPHGVGVGSGFVIDSYGNTSSQCDLIIYEEEFALKFIINDDDNYAYYNCESVIAVGEIKSDATINDIEDSFKKLKKIKELIRYNQDENTFRSYLSKMEIYGAESEKFNPIQKSTDQIFTFILSKSLKTPLKSICEKAKEIFVEKHKYFNFFLPIEGNAITYIDTQKNSLADSAITADAICELSEEESSFNFFINRLIYQIHRGRTVKLNMQRYIHAKTEFNISKMVKI